MPPQDEARVEHPQHRRVSRHWLRAREESATQALAPSEAVLLNGDQFATPAPMGSGLSWFVPQRTWLLHSETAVSRTELLVATISVALLALERNGELKLKVKKGGSLTVWQDHLIVERGSTRGQWPQGSLEDLIGRALVRRSGALLTDNTLVDLIGLIVNGTFWEALFVKLFVNRYVEPYLLNKMADALVAGGIVDLIPDDQLLGVLPYRRARAHLSEGGQKALEQYDLEEVWQLLFRCQKERPAVWSLLEDEIVHGLALADSANLGD